MLESLLRQTADASEFPPGELAELKALQLVPRSQCVVGQTLALAPLQRNEAPIGALGFLWSTEDPPPHGLTDLASAAATLSRQWEETRQLRRLEVANRDLQAAVEATGLTTWRYSLDEACFMLGAHFAEMVGRPRQPITLSLDEILSYVHPDDVATFQSEIFRLCSDPQAAIDSMVRIVTGAAGRWVRFRGRFQPGHDEDDLGTMTGTIQDVHEQVSLDALIVNTLDELADARIKAMEAAQMIQRELLVKTPPRRVGGLRIGSCSYPSQVADGDFFDVLPIGEGIVDLVVGDVMGKGLTAALVGAGLKAQIARTFGLLAAGSSVPSPVDVMQAVHDRAGPQLTKLGSFATLAYARIDSDQRLLELIDCGHTRTLVMSNFGSDYQFLSGEHLPLGILRGEVYRATVWPLEPGDLVVMYSDGLLDVEMNGRPLGESGLVLLAMEACQQSSPVDSLLRSLDDLRKNFQLKDDLTCLVARLGGSPGMALSEQSPGLIGRNFRNQWFPSDLEQLDRLRQFVAEALAELNPEVSIREIAALELGAVETFTNIVRYAHAGRHGETIRVEISIEEDLYVLRLRYRGEPFEPTVEPIPETPNLAKDHGWGLGIIHALADTVEYDQDDRGTVCVTITKSLPGIKRNHG